MKNYMGSWTILIMLRIIIRHLQRWNVDLIFRYYALKFLFTIIIKYLL